MAHNPADDVRNQKLIAFYLGQLRHLGENLFYARAHPLLHFYDNVFDNRPECVELIKVSDDKRAATPTVYAAYREAAFTMESDLSDSAELDKMWTQLHGLVEDAIDPLDLELMANCNTTARWRIMASKNAVLDVIPEIFELLEKDRYSQARSRADKALAELTKTFASIAASYTTMTLLPG